MKKTEINRMQILWGDKKSAKKIINIIRIPTYIDSFNYLFV